jgi:eukaryotic-like serine/threonine-protein kinase
MPDPRWENLKEIFHGALALSREERGAYLDRACDGDALLRQAVESLIKSHDETGFVDRPAYQAAADLLMQDGKLKAGHSVGRYRVVSLIGEGGMGRVYLAEDTKLHRKVSLKFLSTTVTQDHERLRRFEQEARAASALNHPNIITIHEIGEEDGHPFIATEFIEGQTLRERLRSGLDIDDALDIAIQVASALVAAHRVNIVHRDIKPENIMIRKDDGLVKVLDFGLAKVAEPRGVAKGSVDHEAGTLLRANTAPGVVMGTVAYMSPEQARGEIVDERTDIWSLGVVLYEMVAGCSPFVAGTSNEIISAILSKQAPPPLTRYAYDVPERLEEIVEKELTKNRDERYQTSKDLLIDLKRLKQTLQTKAAGERGTSPDPRGLAKSPAREHATESSAPSVEAVSSAEYIVNQVKSHKRGAVITLVTVVLAITTAVLVYAWRARQTTTTVTQPEIKSLAVLPLKSLDAGENYLGFGIADAVIRRISQTGELTVRPTSAVRRYMTEDTDALAAAKQLTADAVLEGTMQRSGDRLRVSVNLLRTNDGVSLWTDSFDTQLSDVFAIQDTVSQQVASRLKLQLNSAQKAKLAKRTTSNPLAYEFYIKGVYSYDQRGFGHAAKAQHDGTIDYFKRATEIEPNYALAHAKLAQAYTWKGLFIMPEEQETWCKFAKHEIAKADALDAQLAETHIARGWLLFSGYSGYQLSAAAHESLKAQQIDPSIGHGELANFLYHVGLEDLTEREYQRLMEIDPTSEFWRRQIVIFYILVNRWDDYLAAKQKYFPNEPLDPGYYLAKGDLVTARKLIDEQSKTESEGADPTLRSMLLALEGNKRASEELVPKIIAGKDRRRPDYHHTTYGVACIYAVNGNVAEAMKWLRETAATGNPSYTLFARDAFLNRIRKSQEFIEFMAELKPQYEKYRSEFQ